MQLVSFSKRMRADERYKSSSCKKTGTVMGCNDVDDIRRILVEVYSAWHVVGISGRAEVGHIDTLPDRRGQY